MPDEKCWDEAAALRHCVVVSVMSGCSDPVSKSEIPNHNRTCAVLSTLLRWLEIPESVPEGELPLSKDWVPVVFAAGETDRTAVNASGVARPSTMGKTPGMTIRYDDKGTPLVSMEVTPGVEISESFTVLHRDLLRGKVCAFFTQEIRTNSCHPESVDTHRVASRTAFHMTDCLCLVGESWFPRGTLKMVRRCGWHSQGTSQHWKWFRAALADGKGVTSMLRWRAGDEKVNVRKAALQALESVVRLEGDAYSKEAS